MQTQAAKLVKISPLTEDVFHYDFEFSSEGIAFKPGQFFMMKVEDEEAPVNRAYSVASPPNTQSFSLCIKLIPDGRGSEFIRAKKEGDLVNFMGPFGHFYLREEEKDIVMVSTGTGLAPFMSMLPVLFEQGFCKPITLLFGVRHKSDLFYVDQLQKWEEEHENFSVVITLSRPDADWEGETGRVTEHLANMPIDLANTKIYICGNGAMVKEVRQQMLDAGLEKTNIHLEQFTPA